jgi:Xaa-Pro aminopeptidase
MEFVKGGCRSENEIVSSGKNTSQPHNMGKGPVYANQPIIIDIYPSSVRNRYFADMTRTVVKGKASPEIKKLYNTVLEGQKLAIKNVKAGVGINSLYKSVIDYFEESGYRTELGTRNPQGFIHGLGHGVGLEIHESPSLKLRNNQKLEAGNVVTIEPGLYYPNIGGVRIEDMVLVKGNGYENLTKFPKVLEI